MTVAHYPAGASKWNPIEHRLFSEISKNWAGRPLDSYETVLNYLRTTTTSTGLKVTAYLVEKEYEKGMKITDAQMKELCITRGDELPKENYVIKPSASPAVVEVNAESRHSMGEPSGLLDLPFSLTRNAHQDVPENGKKRKIHDGSGPVSFIPNLVFSLFESFTNQVQKFGTYL